MIPYAEITETADRRWTSHLMERLVATDLPDDELDDLVGALQAVSDPRSTGTLEAILVNTARPALVREAAGYVLGGMQYITIDVPTEKLRGWWREGDPVLRRHALSCMDAVDCPDIVLQVAADPTHEFHLDSIGRMVFFFDPPEHQQIKIDALSHPDPKVREAAACVLLWDEPVAAEMRAAAGGQCRPGHEEPRHAAAGVPRSRRAGADARGRVHQAATPRPGERTLGPPPGAAAQVRHRGVRPARALRPARLLPGLEGPPLRPAA